MSVNDASRGAMATSQPTVGAQKPQEPASLSLSKKATLIMLASLGVTLLVTGATGSRMLKKGKAPPSKSAPSAGPSLTSSSGSHRASHLTASGGSTGTSKHRSSSQLRNLFATSSSTPGGLDFIANRYNGYQGKSKQALTREIPPPNTSSSVLSNPSILTTGPQAVTQPQPSASEPNLQDSDPTMDALIDAIKAFGIATVLVFGGSTVLVGSLAWKWGSTDVDSFLSTLKESYVSPFSDGVLKPLMPEYVKDKINKYLSNPNEVQEVKNDEKALEDWFQSTDDDTERAKG